MTDLDTLFVHAGAEPDAATGAVSPPISLATTFAQDAPGEHRGFAYARGNNPTRARLERAIAALEGMHHGVAFGSGCAAIDAVLRALPPSARVVVSNDIYGGTHRLLTKVHAPAGMELVFVDAFDEAALRAALAPGAALLWVETPTNPLLRVLDLGRVSEAAREFGVPLAVDNTFATPALQRPAELGAQVVVHSTTKYLNGHSDVVGGAVVTDDEALAERIRFVQNACGAIPSPFDCFLTLRGIRTLGVRMEAQCARALTIARALEAHAAVDAVHYPGLDGHPDHAVASTQMGAFGAVVTFAVKGGAPSATRVVSALQRFTLAEGLGGVESLVGHPVTMSHAGMDPEARAACGITPGHIRLSIGLESARDLLDDLHAGLALA